MQIRKIGIVGFGVMGRGLALHLNSLPVGLDLSVFSNKKNDYDFCIDDYSGFSDCDLIIEAVSESYEKKIEVFLKLNEVVKKEAIVVSNTSSLSINLLSSYYKFQDRFLGMHFFNPVPKMKAVELVFLEKNPPEVRAAVRGFLELIQKEVIEVSDSAGFVVNRLLIPLINEAANLVQEGLCSVEDIDKAMVLCAGHPMGPLKLADLIGVDVVYSIIKQLHEAFGDRYMPSQVLERLVQNGELGRKVGKGFYAY